MTAPPLWMRTGCDPAAMASRARALVAEAYCVSTRDIVRPNRNYRVAWARHVYLWLMTHTGISQRQIIRALKRDRNCLINSKRAVENARDCYQAVRSETDQLLAKFTDGK